MIRWILYFTPALIVELAAWLLTPLVCLFVVRRYHTDKVKRDYNRRIVTLVREFLPDWLSYFATHDNAVDEYWYGRYNEESWFPFIRNCTPMQYATSWWMRYAMRALWLFRNTAYGFHLAWFSAPAEAGVVTECGVKYAGLWWRWTRRPSSWQLQYHLPIPFTRRFIDGNVGFKGHDGFDRMMMANRLIGLRRYK